MTANDRVMLFDRDVERAASIADSLDSIGLAAIRCHREDDAVASLHRSPPGAALMVGDPAGFRGVSAASRALGIPTLAVVAMGDDPRALSALVRDHDAWASLDGSNVEIAARVAGLLETRASQSAATSKPRRPLIDSWFLSLVVHDLRTPLNVIVLTNRSIGHSVPDRNADFNEDLKYLTENTRQIEKMLTLLGDYCRLIEAESEVAGTEFDPRRFLTDFLEDRKERSGVDSNPVRLELAETCPREVALEPNLVATAIKHALANTVAAAGDSPVRLRASGKPGLLVVELIVDKPPADTVRSIDLHSESFERLVGIAAERRGLDLAIAVRVSELFGGTARLEVEPGRRSTLVLEWPERIDMA